LASSPDAPRPVLFIDRPDQLAVWVAEHRASRQVAVDTEFIGERFYRARLEVIQIDAGMGSIAVVDAPALAQHMGPLREFLLDPAVEKIVHAAEMDLRVLRSAFREMPLPVFDTQLAAAFLGHGQQPSLTVLVERLTGVKLDGKQSTSDWGARPLSQAQLAYAADDVRYLHGIRHQLGETLAARGRTAWFDEEQAARILEYQKMDEMPPSELWRRVKGWSGLSRRELAVLRELAIWREERAKGENIPRRQVFADEGLVEVASFMPKNAQAVLSLRRVPKAQAARHGTDVSNVVRRASALPQSEWPVVPPAERRQPPAGVLEVAQALLRQLAEKEEVAPAMIATSEALERYVLASPEERRAMALGHGWRYQIAGRALADLLEGRLALRVGPTGLSTFAPG
jgi:ribonuclease D